MGDNPEEIETYSYDLSNVFEQAGIGPVDTMYLGYRNTCSFNSGLSMCWGNHDYGQLSKITGSAGAFGYSSRDSTQNRSIWDLYLNVNGVGAAGGELLNVNDVFGVDGYAFVRFTNPLSPNLDVMPQKLALGNDFNCALLNNGSVKCIGNASYGIRGINNTTNSSYSSDSLHFINTNTVFAPANLTDLAAGQDHACAVVKSHEVFCWGRNNLGQVGIGTTSTGIGVSFTSGQSILDARVIVFPSLDAQVPTLRSF